MTQLLNTWASGPGHHGVSAAAVFADGTVWSAAAGRAGLSESLQQSHLIAIGSITKTMTAAIVLQLAAEGRLGLDDPIAKHLPPRLYVSPDITIRQLLNHTSGVANYTGTSGLSQLIAASPGHVFTADELLNVIGPPRLFARHGDGVHEHRVPAGLLRRDGRGQRRQQKHDAREPASGDHHVQNL